MKKRIEVVKSLEVFRGFLCLNRYLLRHSLFAGGMSRELMRERVEDLRAVAVLLYDPVLDCVVLVEQFRIGALEEGERAWLLEIAGGVWDPSKSSEQIAKNEAVEESGCQVEALWPIGDYWVSPGTSVERVRLYCGRINAAQAGGIHGLEHEGEDIRAVVMEFPDAIQALEDGRIQAATAVIALQWLALHREEVCAEWTGK